MEEIDYRHKYLKLVELCMDLINDSNKLGEDLIYKGRKNKFKIISAQLENLARRIVAIDDCIKEDGKDLRSILIGANNDGP